MNLTKSAALAAFAGLAGATVISIPGTTLASNADDAVLKRDEQVADLVLVADDDDDTNDDTNDSGDTNTGVSNPTSDNTASNFTSVSRDRDLSRSDKTRDWTMDGGDLTRDRSALKTNDNSRNDTRR